MTCSPGSRQTPRQSERRGLAGFGSHRIRRSRNPNDLLVDLDLTRSYDYLALCIEAISSAQGRLSRDFDR